MWPALIGAGASLLGGILGKPKERSAEQNSREALLGQAAGARKAAEKYGFNPLTLLGVSSAVGPSESSAYMGSAIADAGMMLADGLQRRQDELGQISQLEQQNRELQERVQSLTLRPRVGGVYAQREAVPSVAAAVLADDMQEGGGLLGPGRVSPDPGRPLARRTAENTPRVLVYDPAGKPMYIPANMAAQSELMNFDVLGGQGMEDLFGETGDLVTGLQMAMGLSQGTLTGVSGGVQVGSQAPRYGVRPEPVPPLGLPRPAPRIRPASRYPYWHGRPGQAWSW